MHSLFYWAKQIILGLLLPTFCVGCNKEGRYICTPCLLCLVPKDTHTCVYCHAPSLHGFTHHTCLRQDGLDALYSIFSYKEHGLNEYILAGKYNHVPEIFYLLGERAAVVNKNLFSNCVICPIPLHKKRLRWRGFNQSQIVAEILGAHFDMPVTNILLRHKNTKTQKNLHKDERNKNVKNAFSVDPAALAGLKNKNILLIDDVATTGETLKAAAHALKVAGAGKVFALTLAGEN